MAYFDGFVVPVPSSSEEEYRAFAAEVLPAFIKHGALRCVECWTDDVPRGMLTDFYRAVASQDDETVVFAWIEWPDKATRDHGMAKVTAEMPPGLADGQMPFDGKRMIFGGFRSILDERKS